MEAPTKEEIVFNDVDDLVYHIINRLGEKTTPVKIQKCLYFLYAYYGATFGFIDYEAETEEELGEFGFNSKDKFKSYLFDANFEAWHYGPVDRTVFVKQKNGYYGAEHDLVQPKTDNEIQVFLFLDSLIDQIGSVNDFGLIYRSCQDDSWNSVYNEELGYGGIIDNKDIINEYVDCLAKNEI